MGLGLQVLRNLARKAIDSEGSALSVMFRDVIIHSNYPEKQKEVAELRSLGIKIIAGDLVSDSIDGLYHFASLGEDPSNHKKISAVFAQGRGVAWEGCILNHLMKISTTDIEQWLRKSLR